MDNLWSLCPAKVLVFLGLKTVKACSKKIMIDPRACSLNIWREMECVCYFINTTWHEDHAVAYSTIHFNSSSQHVYNEIIKHSIQVKSLQCKFGLCLLFDFVPLRVWYKTQRQKYSRGYWKEIWSLILIKIFINVCGKSSACLKFSTDVIKQKSGLYIYNQGTKCLSLAITKIRLT